MIRVPVTSSNIRSIGYNEESQTLEVEFHGGEIYQYFNVPKSAYTELMSASSHGSHLHRHIEDNYRCSRIR